MTELNERLIKALHLGADRESLLEDVAIDTRLLRMFTVGPFETIRYRPAMVSIGVPAVVNPQQTLSLVGPVDGPGEVLFISITCTSQFFHLQGELDKSVIDINTDGAMNLEFDTSGAGPTIWVPQADFANGLFTIALVPGSTAGLPFFDSAQIRLRSITTAPFFLMDFYIAVRYVRPLGEFVTALGRNRSRR